MDVKRLKELLADKTKINCAVLILIVVVYLFLFFIPEVKVLFGRLAECSQLKVKIVKTKKDWANIDSFKEKIALLNEQVDYYEKKLPSEKEVAALLEFLSDSAKELNVRITEIKPIEQDKVGEASIYYQVPILLRAECGYHQLGRFLSKLENADRFMKINNIKIEAGFDQGSVLNAQLIVATYVMSRK